MPLTSTESSSPSLSLPPATQPEVEVSLPLRWLLRRSPCHWLWCSRWRAAGRCSCPHPECGSRCVGGRVRWALARWCQTVQDWRSKLYLQQKLDTFVAIEHSVACLDGAHHARARKAELLFDHNHEVDRGVDHGVRRIRTTDSNRCAQRFEAFQRVVWCFSS